VGCGCQRFAEPGLSPLLYNSNIISGKGKKPFEDANLMKNAAG